MVTRATVTQIISTKEVKVNVPAFGLIEELESESQVNETPTARICTVPGCSPNFNVGDVVLICIEDNDLSNPMIMGKLIPDDGKLGTSSSTFQDIKVEKGATLSKSTTIGDVKSNNIEQLVGVNYNIQTQFDNNISQKTELLKSLTQILKDNTI